MMIQASFEDIEKSKGTNISTIPFKLMVAVICFPCTWVTKSPPVKVRAKLGSSPRKSGKCWNCRNGPYDQDLGLYICIPSVSRELLTIKCLKKRENLSAFLKKFFGRLRSWLHNFVTFKQKKCVTALMFRNRFHTTSKCDKNEKMALGATEYGSRPMDAQEFLQLLKYQIFENSNHNRWKNIFYNLWNQ